MPASFAFSDIAEALHDLVVSERHRIELMHWLAARGQVQPPPSVAFAGWRDRLHKLEAAEAFITGLIPHETSVREFDSVAAAMMRLVAERKRRGEAATGILRRALGAAALTA
jgi:hypothetical protein